ncbi:MAG TPA: ABC transporter permease [Puia sp.]|nr:ABC transporter permease [Puia sp.]
MLRNYLKTALRNLSRNKVYSFINIAGLSLGLACSMLILLYVKDELSYDHFHKNAAQIYRVNRKLTRPNGNIDKSGYTGYLQGPRFTANIPQIESFVRYQQGEMDIKSGAGIQSQQVFLADANFFSVFSFRLLSGDPKTALQQPHSVVITEDMAKKQFGTTEAIGKLILFRDGDSFIPYKVTAVAKNCPQNSSIQFSALVPLIASKEDMGRVENWFNSFLNTFVVVNPKASIQGVDEAMQKIYLSEADEAIRMIKEKYGVKDPGISFYLQPLADIHLSKDAPAQIPLYGESNPVFSYVLSGIAIFILIIACINFINLTIARSVKRGKEIGIRKVIGSGRRQLIFQFLGESFLLCGIALVMAILLVQFMLPVFNSLSNKMLSLAYLMDMKLVGGYLALFLFTGLLAGLYPAFILSGYDPVQTLYSRFALAGKNYLQKSLVVFQFTLASFLIIATLTIFSQLRFLTRQPLGYDDTHLIVVDKGYLTRNDAALFKQALLKNPNILDVAARNSGFQGNTVKVNKDQNENMILETIDPSFLSVLKVPVVAGRNFSADFPSDSSSAVLVNEEFVRQAGWKNPIGQSIDFFEPRAKRTVVGVVRDYHFRPLTAKIEPQVFTMDPRNNFGTVYIRIKAGSEASSLRTIEQCYRQLFPLDAYAYDFKDRQNAHSYERETQWQEILFFGTLITIFISCIGLFGLSVLMAEKRVKEIGVRKVLGASVSQVAALLSRDFLKLVMIALFIAIPLAWISSTKWLENYPYRITLSWGLFAFAALLVAGVALVTVSFQAIRASVANPVRSLRSE